MKLFNPHNLDAIVQNDAVCLCLESGIADGITLMCRRGPEAGFSVMAEDERGPVLDTRPKLDPDRPEVRRYCAILRYQRWECCRFSNVVEVTVP